jgi:hypothetical protein
LGTVDIPAMTIDDVIRRVAHIVALARGDIGSASEDAAAHAEEDRLYRDVLAAIASGVSDAPELAGAALKSKDAGVQIGSGSYSVVN